MRSLKTMFFLALLFLVNAVTGQEKKPGMISGYVKDAQTKSSLVEAVVTISSDAFAGTKFALPDSTGLYRVKDLPPGLYTITFEMEGYRKFTQDKILLKEGMSLGVSFQMAKERVRKIKEQEKVEIIN